MAGKEQKTTIGDITFQVTPFMAVEGLRLKARLVRAFGPALGEILGGVDGKNVKSIADVNLAGNSFARGLEKLFEQLDESSFVALVERLFANVIANWNTDGKNRAVAFNQDFETAMNLVFQGRLFSIYPLIVFVLKVNYPDFFDKVVSGIGQRIRTTLTSGADGTTSPNESGNLETLED